jgi:pyruvate dehydrogenase E2 component (dihydrolipoamide acetyltransferase)
MARKIVMPSFGMFTAEGRLLSWLVPPGTRVEEGQVILTIETDKAVQEVIAPAAGILQTLAAVGDALKEEQLLGYVLDEAEPPVATVAGGETISPADAGTTTRDATRGRVIATPEARRIAKDGGVDLTSVKGTGPGGRIVAADISRHLEAPAKNPAHQLSVSELAKRIRRHSVLMTSRGNASHIGSCLSAADMLAVLYGRVLHVDPAQPTRPDRDRFYSQQRPRLCGPLRGARRVWVLPVRMARHLLPGWDQARRPRDT